MPAPPDRLPIDDVLPSLIDALRGARAVVLRAPTGTGKTTRVPPALLEAGILGEGRLLMLQPRRVAARACARRMASVHGERVGETFGYQIRFEKVAGKRTRALVVTEGILTRRFSADPLLEGISCVVLDEFHERSIHTDLALAFLRELMGLRDDLKLVVMSATLRAAPIAAYLGDCPVLEVAARNHPLRIEYLPMPPKTRLGDRVAAGLDALLRDPEDDNGHILVFLPGAPEIRWVAGDLAKRGRGLEIVQLHGSLSGREQDAVLAPSARRRVILATNIAETSLTIPGVTAVIDSGRHKMLIHDPGRGLDRLDLTMVSRAGADQRAGRAGRTGPGRVIRLWDENRHAGLVAEDPPEICRTDLTGPLMGVIDFHGPDLDAFPFFERPERAAIEGALATLRLLGALDDAGRLTERGKRLAGLPLHPRTAAVLEQGTRSGLTEQAAGLCALLGEKPPFPDTDDLTEELRRLERGADRDQRVRRVLDARRQLLDQAERLWKPGARRGSWSEDDLAAMVLAGYPDRLCVVREPGRGIMVGGRGVRFDRPAGRALPDYLLALELVETNREAARVRRLLPVGLNRLKTALAIEKRETAVWDENRAAAAGVRQLVYGDLVLEEKHARVSADRLAAVLAEHAAADFDRWFAPNKEAADLLARLRFAGAHLSELSWPDVSRKGLIAILPEVCQGKHKLDMLAKLDWKSILLNRLDYSLRQVLDREVPERLEVPSGSKVRIDYAPALEETGHPVLAVRLQEVFGLHDTPRVAKGRVSLLFHLLAPNMRPAQVTRDLRNFWDTTYAEVRKELRMRYPKHAWPEDPWTAKAIRGVPRRKKPFCETSRGCLET